MAITREEAQANNIAIIDSETINTDQKHALIEQVKQLLPNVVNSDNVVNTQALQDLFDLTNTTSNNQGYELTFAGKGIAKKKADTATNKQLAVDKELSKNFDTTENVIIKGDNLDALKILKKNYHNQIKMIYIDPPYNTEQAFIYPDNFKTNDAELIKELGLNENTINYLTNTLGTNTHSKWLSFMYPRLLLARDLLKDDGVIFISIDDSEQANLKIICDEIFGPDNFVTNLHIQMSSVQGQKVRAAKQGNIVKNAEYILTYSKKVKKNIVKNVLYDASDYDTHYSLFLEKKEDGVYFERALGDVLLEHNEAVAILDKLELRKKGKITNNAIADAYKKDNSFRQIIHDLSENIVSDDKCSALKLPSNLSLEQGVVRFVESGGRGYFLTVNSNDNVRQRMKLSGKIKQANNFLSTYGTTNIRGDWWPEFYKDMGNVSKEGGIPYPNGKKPTRLIKQLAYMIGMEDHDIVLDFFGGSGTTGHAIMDLNSSDGGQRKFIIIQIEETIDPNHKDGKPLHKLCLDNNLPTDITSITIERINRAGIKLLEENPELTGKLDIGYRVLTLEDKPSVNQDDNGNFSFNLEDKTPLNTLFNMLVATGKNLDNSIENIKENTIYQVDNCIYILDKVTANEVEQYSKQQVYFDSMIDFDLEDYLNLDLQNKENIQVIFY